MSDCELCASPGGEIVWQDDRCRVVRVGGAEGLAFPGFCRIVWRAHVAEMTRLDSADRRHLMSVVFATEAALRALLHPDKINLASLGNVVPHLHWHVIPRWRDDSHFPAPVWVDAKRAAPPRQGPDNAALAAAIAEILGAEASGA
ncbi:MAG: HIT family protein [Rhodocyclaceae bacterium]|nr:HIT family protein [Rhodocyclaceae bacterium]